MNPIVSFITTSYCFWIIAVIISGYYGVRGYFYQVFYEEKPNNIPTWGKVIVNRIHDTIYNLVTAFSGFVALYTLQKSLTLSKIFAM